MTFEKADLECFPHMIFLSICKTVLKNFSATADLFLKKLCEWSQRYVWPETQSVESTLYPDVLNWK